MKRNPEEIHSPGLQVKYGGKAGKIINQLYSTLYRQAQLQQIYTIAFATWGDDNCNPIYTLDAFTYVQIVNSAKRTGDMVVYQFSRNKMRAEPKRWIVLCSNNMFLIPQSFQYSWRQFYIVL